jgi:hypothetical protein
MDRSLLLRSGASPSAAALQARANMAQQSSKHLIAGLPFVMVRANG